MGYVQIPFGDIQQFLLGKGFLQVDKVPDSKEIGFAKMYENKNLVIFIMTGFEKNKHQRGYGEDAIRGQLISKEQEKPLMDLASTKRMDGWKETLDKKINLLEALVETYKPCPKCGSYMVVIHGQFNDPVLWLCSKFKSDRDKCQGSIKPDLKLQTELAIIWPKYKKKK